MRAQQLRASLAGMTDREDQHAALAGLPPLVTALCWEARGDWEKAHLIAQDVPTRDGAWVHAYLHRSEGDLGNAGYWYRQAGRPIHKGSLDQEWEEIVDALLSA